MLVWIVGTICAVLAFLLVRLEAKLDERDFYRERGVTHPKVSRWKATSDAAGLQWMYGFVAVVSCLPIFLGLLSAVLYADVPIGDPCALLEPYSWKWYLLGCLWSN